ncbi:GIY-YIG nuclease family protein [Thiobacillus sedimenti]|uniref:GIY-YIG nuclease family protein n=1 Tax=Thiobacillus sedimenti TaxID=3110231 RepID=A0ABZ1CKE8_9PROT|nr:GIY-YIG nuclease family protein [Thiobacillus sp. SCUT-2]WRS39341.1 GIY-YIG nuclease family protein [Thiobacillus sp. SCUT-2]
MGAAAVGRRLNGPPSAGPPAGWCVYILRCADGTLYTGITTDVARRVAEHNGDGAGGARYTRARRPVELVHVEAAADRIAAMRREAAIKRLDRGAKLALCGIASPTR